jgi:circadian clock protein KaiC
MAVYTFYRNGGKMERVETGIAGLDSLIGGGIPKGFNVLIVGRPGTGKTIFGLQYLYNGALKGENGLYVTIDAAGALTRQQAETLGWNFKKLESEKKICILDVPLNRQLRLNLFRLIETKVKEYNVKRIVFDSLSSFMFNINQFNIRLPNIDDLTLLSKEDAEYLEEDIGTMEHIPEAVQKLKPDPVNYSIFARQRVIYLMFKEFSTLGTTNVMITSASSKTPEATVDGVSEYVADGVIDLKSLAIGETLSRTLSVKKMRFTDMDGGIKSYDITSKGLTLVRE